MENPHSFRTNAACDVFLFLIALREHFADFFLVRADLAMMDARSSRGRTSPLTELAGIERQRGRRVEHYREWDKSSVGLASGPHHCPPYRPTNFEGSPSAGWKVWRRLAIYSIVTMYGYTGLKDDF